MKLSHGGITLPVRHHLRHDMIDSRCRKIKKEIEGMKEEEANFHFCTMSEAGQEVFASELSHVSGAGLSLPGPAPFQIPDGGNHWHTCKQYLHY
jgi:hypothetical protein